MSYTAENTKNSPIKNTNMNTTTTPIKNNLNTKIDKKLVGMTVWMLDDTEMDYGRFRWFDTVFEARKRFDEIKGGLFAALIEFKGAPVFAWEAPAR